MLKKQDMSKRNQIGFYSLEDLVPQEHFLRDIDKYVEAIREELMKTLESCDGVQIN